MTKKKTFGRPWIVKGTPNLKKKLDEARIERVKNGLDNEMKSYSELLEASTRFAPLWDILKRAELKTDVNIDSGFDNENGFAGGFSTSRKSLPKRRYPRDNKGQFITFNIYTFIIVAFLVVVLFAGLIYVMGLVNGVFQQVGLANEVNAGQAGYVNMTQAANQTFGVLNNSIQALRMVAFVYIIGFGVVTVFSSAFARIHPIFFFAYLLIVILGVIFAVPVANAYNQLYTSGLFAGTLQSFQAANYIVLNLPAFTLIIGILGAIFMFISLVKEGGPLR